MSPPALIDSPATIDEAESPILNTGEFFTDILFSIIFSFEATPRDESHAPQAAIAATSDEMAVIHSGVIFINLANVPDQPRPRLARHVRMHGA